MQKRGHFVQPDSSADFIRQLEELGSPIIAFIHQRCEVGPGYSVAIDALFKTWQGWCASNGHHSGDSQSFGKDLRTAYRETYAALKPKYGAWVIFDHCLPFDVTRAYDEATRYRDPRIWTAQRDKEMWQSLEG